MPSRQIVAEIVADGGIDDGLVLDDRLATLFHSLLFGQNPKLPRVWLVWSVTVKINCQVRCALRNVWI